MPGALHLIPALLSVPKTALNSEKNDTPLRERITPANTDEDIHGAEIDASDGRNTAQISEKALLEKLSPLFDVKQTSYGGRGCFANCAIPKGTVVLNARKPMGSGVVRAFRKEVCTRCFHYNDGKTLKHRLHQKIYFCLENCLSKFLAYDPQEILANTLVRMEDMFLKCHSDQDEQGDVKSFGSSEEFLRLVDEKWAEVAEWVVQVTKTKPTKRARFHPLVSTEDYTEIRYVLMTLYNLFREEKASFLTKDYVADMDDDEALAFEKHTLDLLCSSELNKIEKYTYLLDAYANIFKFVWLVAPDEFRRYVTPQAVRDIIGKSLTNAFGIWSPTTNEDEDREFFGYGVYPSGSFFNHACEYNVKKIRNGASHDYVTVKDIQPGSELYICYGTQTGDLVQERRKALSEWFFTCGCEKCIAESKLV